MLFLGKLTACNFKYSYEKCLLNVLSAVHVSLRNTSVSFLLVILEKSFSSVQVDISLIDQMLKQKGLYSWCVSGNSVEDSSSSTNNLFCVCFPRALKGWQGSLYILYVSCYSHTQKNATHFLGNEYSYLEVTVLMFLFFSLLFHVQQCDLIQFMRDHSREYLCVLGHRWGHLGRKPCGDAESVGWTRWWRSPMSSAAGLLWVPAAGTAHDKGGRERHVP